MYDTMFIELETTLILSSYGGVDHLKKSKGGNIMKDFLEELEIGEGKVKLSKEEIKSILAKHGDYIKIETEKVDNKYKSQLEDNKNTINDLKKQIEESPKSDEMESLKTKIADYEQKEADRIAKQKAEEEDKILTDNINALFEGKTFTSDYARNGLMNDIKNGLNNPENKGKGIQDLFNELTKDKTDIFANPNQQKDMEGMGDSEQDNNTKEMPIIW